MGKELLLVGTAVTDFKRQRRIGVFKGQQQARLPKTWFYFYGYSAALRDLGDFGELWAKSATWWERF